MSEKIYACLLRLYPDRFRKAFGEAALQLFRDRSRHERGLFSTLRLWFDLLADLAVSVPLEYRCVQQTLIGANRQRFEGQPSFRVLEGESPRLEALAFGVVLSLVAAFTLSLPVGHAEPRGFHSNAMSALAALEVPQQPSERPQVGKLDAAERQRIVRAVIANLKQYYIDPDVAQKIADSLLANEKAGKFDALTDGAAFADRLTTQIRDVSQDRHMIVEYSKAPLPDRPPGPPPGALERYRKAMEQENCTFEKVQVLEHNIGYLKLNSFPDPSVCGPTATAAMASVNHADAIIFDLRDNRGGYPDMVALIAAYLFDHPEYWYNPRENTTEQSWTRSPVPGSLLADKPVFVLTSARTFSGAEHFSYDLKMLKRATLVGETTRGAAHAGRFHRIDDHFGMGITEVRAINPFSKTDWEGTGVEPDVKVKAVDALITAEKLAERKFRKK